jgi:hypothetical protein
MDRSLGFLFSVFVAALLGLFFLLGASYLQPKPAHHGPVKRLAVEKRVP